MIDIWGEPELKAGWLETEVEEVGVGEENADMTDRSDETEEEEEAEAAAAENDDDDDDDEDEDEEEEDDNVYEGTRWDRTWRPIWWMSEITSWTTSSGCCRNSWISWVNDVRRCMKWSWWCWGLLLEA